MTVIVEGKFPEVYDWLQEHVGIATFSPLLRTFKGQGWTILTKDFSNSSGVWKEVYEVTIDDEQAAMMFFMRFCHE